MPTQDFGQVKLDKTTSLLTTFITPFGRYCFNRLPFGITSAPEYSQKKLPAMLSGEEGFVCLMDDILIYGRNNEEHQQRLEKVLNKLRNANVTLNVDKCQFLQPFIKFLGQIVNKDGIKPDPAKVQAIREMPAPTNISEVRHFMGMVNQLGKFCPQLANKDKPIHELLSNKNDWYWGQPQQQAFQLIKQDISSAPLLALYNPELTTTVSADASSYGLGAVLIQTQQTGEIRPVAYISRALTSAEQRYAQI